MKHAMVNLILVLVLQACTLNNDPSIQQVDSQPPAPKAQPQISAPQQHEQQEALRSQAEVLAATSYLIAEQDMASGSLVKRHAYAPMADSIGIIVEPNDRENYAHFDDNVIKRPAEQPVSTFSIDVDTGAYTNVRRFINQGRLPNKDAVRVEEMINYFSYNYAPPKHANKPFSVTTELAPSPWNKHNYLLHVGVQGYQLAQAELPPANLVLLVDVSGSMQSQDKLGLLKSGLKMLVNTMDADDRISMVVYAGASGVVLEPTPGDQHTKIISALDKLAAGGSTNGAAGIRLAYQMAQQAFIKDGINRILLATDGDFNVGTTDFETLKQLVEQQRNQGVALTTLGFGTGNYNDHLMEQLADVGNGNYSYIDNLNEARKVLVEQMSATLNTIAKDVKIQIEFNPALVAEYRLIGYENRQLKREDFNNDKVDAGEIGAGHSVTALYEISLTGSKGQKMDSLRYSREVIENNNKDELALLRIRYKQPQASNSQLIEQVVRKPSNDMDTSEDFRFSAAVAAFGQQLRGGQYLDDFDYDDIIALARKARGNDDFGYRSEFIQLVSLAKTLTKS